MTRVMSATEAPVHFGELLRRVVEDDETVVVERGGKPRAVVISLAAYDRLRAGQAAEEDWWELAARSRRLISEFRQGRPLPDIEELIHEMRVERDAQLLDAWR
jgi:prevent-host-death family protein